MKKILILLFTGMIFPVGLMAQKAYKDGSNRVILDLTVEAGMPAGAVTNVSKTTQYISFTPSASVLGANNAADGTLNAKVYEKLEIAPRDLNTTGGMDGTGTMTMNWVTAFNACKNSTYDNGGWRLATQRELMLMYIFQPALENIFTDATINGAAFSTSSYYWGATEFDAANSWYVWFRYGNSYTNTGNAKTNEYRVRCVREVTD